MKLNAQKMRIVGVYAPNRSQDRFWETVYNELLVELQGPVLMMVDFNAFLKNHLDRSESDTPVFSATCLNYKKGFLSIICLEIEKWKCERPHFLLVLSQLLLAN